MINEFNKWKVWFNKSGDKRMEIRVTDKGSIIIPLSLRRKYGIKNGTKIIIADNGDLISLKPITEKYLKKLQGSLKGKGGLKVLVEDRQIDSK